MNFLWNELFEVMALAKSHNILHNIDVTHKTFTVLNSQHVLFSLYFILITVLVSVFLFSLEGEDEDGDLVIAKGLYRPVIEFLHWHSVWLNSHFGIPLALQLFLFKIDTKSHFIFHVRT